MSVDIKNTVDQVKRMIIENGSPGELEYFNYHEKRYLRMANSMVKNVQYGGYVLDIGSHFLHSSMILSLLGFKVVGMDVSEFWSMQFVKERAEKFNIESVIQDDLQLLSANDFGYNRFDGILFTEILEHITFNPINFWHQIYHLLKDKGKIYISTPNALSSTGILRALKNLFTFRGLGISIEMIFSQVTYGHHWKEYSARELKGYFSQLSNGFHVDLKRYGYQKFDNRNFTYWFWSTIRLIGDLTYVFCSDLEAVITVDKSSAHVWKLNAPDY